VDEDVRNLTPGVIGLRQELHQIPELAFQDDADDADTAAVRAHYEDILFFALFAAVRRLRGEVGSSGPCSNASAWRVGWGRSRSIWDAARDFNRLPSRKWASACALWT